MHLLHLAVAKKDKGTGKRSRRSLEESTDDNIRDLTQAQVRACLADIKKNENYCDYLVVRKEQALIETEKAKLAIRKLKLEYEMLKIEIERKADMLDAASLADRLKKATE